MPPTVIRIEPRDPFLHATLKAHCALAGLTINALGEEILTRYLESKKAKERELLHQSGWRAMEN